jgi:hypothetical protein
MEAIMAAVSTTVRSPGSADLQLAIVSRILRIVGVKKVCDLEELLAGCAPYTENQVFVQVDQLSCTGRLALLYTKDGDYAVSIPSKRATPRDNRRSIHTRTK